MVQFVSESLSNLFEYGNVKKAIIEHYHPTEPSPYILKVGNPRAPEWDYKRMGEKGRGGFKTFSREFALASYENSGRDFLALITIPFEESLTH